MNEQKFKRMIYGYVIIILMISFVGLAGTSFVKQGPAGTYTRAPARASDLPEFKRMIEIHKY
jgi:hypothetical protein